MSVVVLIVISVVKEVKLFVTSMVKAIFK